MSHVNACARSVPYPESIAQSLDEIRLVESHDLMFALKFVAFTGRTIVEEADREKVLAALGRLAERARHSALDVAALRIDISAAMVRIESQPAAALDAQYLQRACTIALSGDGDYADSAEQSAPATGIATHALVNVDRGAERCPTFNEGVVFVDGWRN